MRKAMIVLGSVVGIVILLVAGWFSYYYWQQRTVAPVQQPTTPSVSKSKPVSPAQPEPLATMTFLSPKGVSITLDKWAANKQIKSPQVISGTVPGNWSFEASFPVELLDTAGKVLAKAPAHLTGDWMTEQPVPFSVTLSFTVSASEKGILRLHKDNPSGLAANDDAIDIPVQLNAPQ